MFRCGLFDSSPGRRHPRIRVAPPETGRNTDQESLKIPPARIFRTGRDSAFAAKSRRSCKSSRLPGGPFDDLHQG